MVGSEPRLICDVTAGSPDEGQDQCMLLHQDESMHGKPTAKNADVLGCAPTQQLLGHVSCAHALDICPELHHTLRM